MNQKELFRKGLHDGLPICLGYLSVSFAFGMRAVESGLPFWAALLISMTNLTSAGQFAGIDLMRAGSGFLEIAVTTFVINIRYMLMSLSLSQKTGADMTGPRRAALSFGITDEIFAVSMQQPGNISSTYLTGLILTPYLGWAFGTLLGATATGLMPVMVRSALGIAIYGMFIAIIIPPAVKARPIAVTILLSAGLSLLMRYTPLFRDLSGGWVIILCTVIAAAFAALRYPAPVEEEDAA